LLQVRDNGVLSGVHQEQTVILPSPAKSNFAGSRGKTILNMLDFEIYDFRPAMGHLSEESREGIIVGAILCDYPSPCHA
jgi:hypothetical protein